MGFIRARIYRDNNARAEQHATSAGTGGAGYVGAQTCKALAQRGYLPITFDNLSHGHAWAVKWGPLVHGDLADADLLAHTLETYSIDAVLHFAAYACPAESMREPARYFRNNVCNTLTFLECMVKAGVRNIVFSSTCATYGIPARLPVSENAPQLPISPYGESKLTVERILHWWGRAYMTTLRRYRPPNRNGTSRLTISVLQGRARVAALRSSPRRR